VFETPEKAEDNSAGNSGTLGTGFLYPRAYINNESNDDLCISKLIGSDKPVPSVPIQHSPVRVSLPYLTSSGDLVIPFSSPERYHWWKGGQSVHATKQELLERMENDASAF
jgi:hypothetical protein